MFKNSRLSLSKQNNGKQESEKQKQKKRLSFKDPPEVDKVQWTPQESSKIELKADSSCNPVVSIEDLRLEDHAFQIARDVGFAFVKPDPSKLRNASRTTTIEPKPQTVLQKDQHPEGDTPPARITEHLSNSIQYHQKDFLDELSPLNPLSISMKCPGAEPPSDSPLKNASGMLSDQPGIPTFAQHQIQLLHYQLEQQKQQTQTAMYQIHLLKDQLDAETTARYKAQVQNHQLMVQNKDLVNHIEKLFQQVQSLEKKVESYEEDRGASVTSLDAKQAGDTTTTVPQSPRRNSSSVQPLWSNASQTTSLNPMRRTSSASFTYDSKFPTDSKLSREELPPKYNSPYDSDWRYRRRGSATICANVTALSGKTEPNASTAAGTSSRRSPFAIPELKFPDSKEDSSPQVDQTVGSKKDTSLRLSIADRSDRRSVSPAPVISEQSTRYFKPIQVDKPPKTIDKEMTGQQKKFTKSLDALRLFSS